MLLSGPLRIFPRSCLAASRATTVREQRVQSCPCTEFAPCCSPGRSSEPRATGHPGLLARACPALPLLATFPLSRDTKSDFSHCREAGFWRIATKSAPHRGLVHQQWVGVAVPAQLEEFVGSAGVFFLRARCFCTRDFITNPAVSHL